MERQLAKAPAKNGSRDKLSTAAVDSEALGSAANGSATGGAGARVPAAARPPAYARVAALARRLLSPVFLEAFVLTFLAEWGDRSQARTLPVQAPVLLRGHGKGAEALAFLSRYGQLGAPAAAWALQSQQKSWQAPSGFVAKPV